MKEKNIEEPFKDNIEDWTLVTKDIADLMVKQCELALTGSIDSCESVINRADKLIGIYIPICTALSIYILSKIKDFKTFHELLNANLYLSALLCFFVSLIGLIICFINTKNYIIRGVGSDPEKILSTKYIDNDNSSDLKYAAISLAICTNAKIRMDKNNQVALSKAKLNNRAIYFLFALPICPILIYFFHWMFVC